MKKSLVTAALAGGLLLGSAVPASAAEADGCFLGSPNIVRDVTDCAAYVAEGLGGCFIGSPNIIRDVTDCVTYLVDHLTV